MKNRFYIVLLLIMISYNGFSQKDSTQIAHNIIYIEIAGIGGYSSINYERVLLKKNDLMFAMRLGLNTYNIKDFANKFNPDILIPLSVNGYYGTNHKIELGIGQTLASIVYADVSDYKPARTNRLNTNLSFGYRYQEANGIVFRCTYTPIIENNGNFRHWGGISFGYSF